MNETLVQKTTMLIVDDEPNVCMTLKLIFEREGFVVSAASSAAEGIQLLRRRQHYDLVLTDLHMEREDIGLELVRVAKQLDPPPVLIVVTGYASVHNARAALDLHVDHFAIKPVEILDLLAAVRRLAGARADGRNHG